VVQWRGRATSRNIEDRRAGAGRLGGSGLGGGRFLPMLLIRLVFTKFGIVGVLVLVGGYLGLQALGIEPLRVLEPEPAPSRQAAPGNDERFAFAGVILAETEAVWTDIFAAGGGRYPEPTLVVFRGGVESACGSASSASGPFYCPSDRRIYLDTEFFDELGRRFGASGDFPAAYVIAHEVGHHVQAVLGALDTVHRRQQGLGRAATNALQVRVELQADCYAGVWAHHAERTAGLLDAGDIEEGLRAAAAIGDDRLQRNAGRRVDPDSFTHGSSDQRRTWFQRGYRSGSPGACDTFANGS